MRKIKFKCKSNQSCMLYVKYISIKNNLLNLLFKLSANKATFHFFHIHLTFFSPFYFSYIKNLVRDLMNF